jgi:glyceraldehyde 3-phosphate dehydrogenase
LTLWHHISRKHFDEIVVNVGRQVGKSLSDIAHYLERDSTYGSLQVFLYGHRATKPVIEIKDEASGLLVIDKIPVKLLRKARNPREIAWAAEDVRLVVDTTGQFLDPTVAPEDPKGSCMGHLEAGAQKVIVSAPFKIKDKGISMPDYAVTTVMGINAGDYDPRRHKVISHASCTTTCLAHMMKPLMEYFGPKRILSASMATVHAVTGSQAVLDRVPKAGADDLRKTRSIMDNIILTSTGAAKNLSLVIPEMKRIGFIAESVRVPVATGSLIILVLNLQDDINDGSIRREVINDIYRKAAAADKNGYLVFSEAQNVSTDIVGYPRAAAIIEGHEIHTRTANLHIDPAIVCAGRPELTKHFDSELLIPITQTVIYGWYDNEYGSFVNLLGDRTVTIAEEM